MIETKRLLLRKYTMDDFEALYEIMSDLETMELPYKILMEKCSQRSGITFTKNIGDGDLQKKLHGLYGTGCSKTRSMTRFIPI